jgi:hypothetical protein
MVNEELLWVLWQHLLFSVESLHTTTGEPIIIKHTGTLNVHAGPDFSLAKLCIDGIEWAGDVEIHTKASDWYKHKHQHNPAYESVILHVVYEADIDITRADGSCIPVLELKNRIHTMHLETYRYLMEEKKTVPCAHAIHEIPAIVMEQMKQRVLIERLERKTDGLFQLLTDQPNWKMIAGRLIFKSFGTGLNDYLFERMAQQMDFNKLDRLSYAPKSIEALFFGCSGMLEKDWADDFPAALKKEYTYLQRTQTVTCTIDSSEWKFLRTRPVNFPTIRLAQLAALFSNTDWYASFSSITSVKYAEDFLNVSLSDYWLNHYRFDVLSKPAPKHIGKTFANTFLLNAYIPFLVLHARYYKNETTWEQVFEMLDTIQAEDNAITRVWKELGIRMETGFDSQSGLELYKMYCTHKKCLSCSIGFSILRNASVSAVVK